MSVIFFISIIIIAIMLMFKKKGEDREELIKQIMALVVAAFIVLSAVNISGTLNTIIGNMTTTVNGDVGQEQEIFETEEPEEKGFWEKVIDQIFAYVADAAETAKNYLLGTDEEVGIRAILHKASTNPLANFNVPKKGGGEVNLYSLVLNGTSFLTFLMVINTAYKLMKFSWNPSKREEVINALSKWAYIIVLMAFLPGLFAAITKIMDILMNLFSEINLDYVLTTDEDIIQYGIIWAVLRIIMVYVEFKIYIVMIYRIFVINMYYITSPIAIYLWGISDNFTAANSWLNGIVVNVFSPIAYELTFIMGIVLINTFYKGNGIASFITMLFALTVADVIKGIVNYKISGNILGGVQDVKNVTRGIFTTAMTAVTVAKLGNKIAKSKIFQAPNTKVPHTTGGTFTGKEKASSENKNTYNTQNKTDQLGKTSISNKDSVSQNQSGIMNENQFSQNKTNQLGQISINKKDNNFSGKERTPDNINIQNKAEMRSGNDKMSEPKTMDKSERLNKSNNEKLSTTTNNFDNKDNNLGNNSNIKPSKLKEGISTVKKGIQTGVKGVPIAAGIGATIATGNPIFGYAAGKGANMAVNAAQNIITGGVNVVKQTTGVVRAATDVTKNTVQKINKAIKSNSDFKVHRRN